MSTPARPPGGKGGGAFDYSDPAELYGGVRWSGARKGLSYRRFNSAAEAIRYVVEEVPHAASTGCVLEVRDERLTYAAMRKLYDSGDFPLPRKVKGSPPARKTELPARTP